jgi:hypothetical protein
MNNVFANPVLPPQVISEFYYNDGNWQLELFFDQEECQSIWNFENFDGLRLVSKTDTAYFNANVPFQWDSILVITASDLSSALTIDPLDELLNIQTMIDTSFWMDMCVGISYGYDGFFLSTYHCSPPGPNESIGFQRYVHQSGTGADRFRPHKQSPPSIGTDLYQIDSRASFSGYVFDQHGNPVPDIYFAYCNPDLCTGWTLPPFICFTSDSNGYFEASEMFCNIFVIKLLEYHTAYHFLTDTVFFEPDSAVYKEYILTDVGIIENNPYPGVEITVAPNPFQNKTRFSLDIPEEMFWKDAKIIIRNLNGQLLDFIPLTANPWAGGELSVDWIPGNLPKGLYIYSLMMDGQVVESGKLIMY